MKQITKQSSALLLLLLILCAGVTVFAAAKTFGALKPYAAAGREYAGLQKAYAPQITAAESAAEAAAGALMGLSQKPAPADVNPDYIGWLEITGKEAGDPAHISYPVVQGKDNDKYLSTTFEGRENKLGAIFLDYRCDGGFDAPHAIVYGHNARDGSMFGSLDLLKADADGQYPAITITTVKGETLSYRIYAVRQTDIYDPAYRLEFAEEAELLDFAARLEAPPGAARLLTLSTCTDGGSMDERLLVMAALQTGD